MVIDNQKLSFFWVSLTLCNNSKFQSHTIPRLLLLHEYICHTYTLPILPHPITLSFLSLTLMYEKGGKPGIPQPLMSIITIKRRSALPDFIENKTEY